MATRKVTTLGPTQLVHQPDYELIVYRDGNPRRRLSSKQINLRSVTAIQTSKNINDLAGTFTIQLKDGRARHLIREMDVIRIRLKGHSSDSRITVLKGVVDRVAGTGSASPGGSSEDTVITGRCSAKYLQVTSMFLPVWDPQGQLPTALTFGLGDATKKVGGNRPYDIFRYLIRKYTYATIGGGLVGTSGIPNSRYWLDHYTRFAKHLGYQVPYLQFNEESVGDALKRMEILGFTEAWVDELGRIVYRRPAWDAPVAFSVSTNQLLDWDLDRSDVGTATYVEVIPAGDPGIDSATAQALRAGRAPIPSSYIAGAETSLRGSVDPSFVIQTDSRGRPTRKGKRNHWYKLQRRLGIRPQQVTSPLIFSQQQAQKQAEGLLRFFSRMVKGGTITLPGFPEVKLGTNIRVHGELDGQRIDRVLYIEGVQHDYLDGNHYTTTLTLTHGRDPWDPKWRNITLPRFDPAALSADGGLLDPDSNGGPVTLGDPGTASGRMFNEAARIDARNLPYGVGGHGQTWAAARSATSYDCSSSTSMALHAGGFMDNVRGPQVSDWFLNWGVAGRGDAFTVWVKPGSGPNGHVYIEFYGRNAKRFDTSPHGSGGRGPHLRYTDRPTSGFQPRRWPGV